MLRLQEKSLILMYPKGSHISSSTFTPIVPCGFIVPMAAHFSLPLLLKPLYSSRSVGFNHRSVTKVEAPALTTVETLELGNPLHLNKSSSFAQYSSSLFSSSRLALSSSASYEVETEGNDIVAVDEAVDDHLEFNRVNCLLWVLHESAKSFSLAVESLELAGTGPELAMAWNGKDVHEWHKRIAYQVAVYALLKTAVEVEILLSQDRHNNPSPAKDILSPKINILGESIERQLKAKHAELIQWFRVVELPRISGFFIPLLKKWSMEYAGSGVAGIIIAISCYAAVAKLGCEKLPRHLFTSSMEDVLKELMDLAYSLVEVEKLYNLATEAGFELDFLSHFGANVFPYKDIEVLEFWIGLVHRKISAAVQKEIVIKGAGTSHEKFQANNLATLGLFAYLGRETRVFFSKVNMKDLDELVKDFLGYLECGSVFIYPELASVSAYQTFMDVVVDEVGWLEFYREVPCHERRRSKPHPVQAEKEIILSTVFTACYDVFSGFAHFTRSNQQPLDAQLLAFLLRSQSLLTICMEDYRVVYDRSREPETGSSIHTLYTTSMLSNTLEKPIEIVSQGCPKPVPQQGSKPLKEQAISSATIEVIILPELSAARAKPGPARKNFVRRYARKIVSASSDILMGTQLLFVDIMDSLELIQKQLRGHKFTKRERKKLQRMLNDIAALIPVTILMLIPVSAVGHAAMLAALNKYMPFMIPSPFSSERLDVVKQLKRTKKLEVRKWSNLEDSSPRTNLEDSTARNS